MSGWVKLHRDLQQWEWYQQENCLRVFIDILLQANYEDGQYRGTFIPKGSLTTSPEKIGLRTGLSRQQVRTVLDKLELTSEITTQSTNQFTMISVTNWEKFQCKDDQVNQPDNQPVNKRITTSKKLRTKEPKNKASGASLDSAESILEMLNQVCTRSFKATEPNLRCIKARLKEGYNFEDFKLVTEDRFKDWENNQKMRRFIQPKTFFNEDNFDGYLQTAKASLRPKSDPLKAILLSAGWKPESQTDESSEPGDV